MQFFDSPRLHPCLVILNRLCAGYGNNDKYDKVRFYPKIQIDISGGHLALQTVDLDYFTGIAFSRDARFP
jgi:hypothetical protein